MANADARGTRLFDVLTREHALIERTLDAFDIYVRNIEHGSLVERRDLMRFVTFFREFGHHVHQHKEEHVLFPALARHGYAIATGPLAQVRREHQEERRLTGELLRAATVRDPWSDGEAHEVVSTALALSAFMRAHMAREDDLLYPIAYRELTQEDPGLVSAELTRLRAARPEHVHWLQKLSEQLCAAYQPTSSHVAL